MKTHRYTVETIAVLLALFWFFAAVARLIPFQALRLQFFDFQITFTTDFGGVSNALLSVVELLLGAILFIPRLRMSGLRGSLILLALYAINMLVTSPICGYPITGMADLLPICNSPVDIASVLFFISLASFGYWIAKNEKEDEQVLRQLFREKIHATSENELP